MTEKEYKPQEDELFGKRCYILTDYIKRPMIYRIVASGTNSNAWCEPPIMVDTEPIIHDEFENVVFVVLDTLISEDSEIIRVAEKDITLIEE